MSPNARPLVSVVMAVRNGMPWIQDAIGSILAQSLQDLELIVVDDGSGDGTVEFVRSVDDQRVRLLRNPGTGGGAARFAGLQEAQGEYVAWMDADDISMPSRLEEQVELLRAHPEVIVVGTQVDFLVDKVVLPASRYPVDPDLTLRLLRDGRVALCDSSVMMVRKPATGIKPRVQGPGWDFDFYLRLSRLGVLTNTQSRLLLVRVTTTSVSFTRVKEQLFGIAFAVACDRARQAGDVEPTLAAFQEQWRQRASWKRLTEHARAEHQRRFRRSVIERGRGRPLKAILNLGLSAALYPPAALRGIKRRWMPGWRE